MMNPEIKQKWVEALRSGKYKQTREKLKARNGAMCCLGVLEHKVLGKEYKYDSGIFGNSYVNEDGSKAAPSLNTRDEAELHDRYLSTLMIYNDDERWSFKQIADYVEEHY